MGFGEKAAKRAVLLTTLIALSTSLPIVQNNSTETLESTKGDNDDAAVYLELQFDQENSDVNYSLSFNKENAESGETYQKSKDVETYGAQPVVTCWNKPDLKTRVCVSVEKLPNNTGINRNDNIDIVNPNPNQHTEKNLTTCKNSTKLVVSNETLLTPTGHNDDNAVVNLELRFDQDYSDANYSLIFNNKDTKNGDTYEESKDVVETHDAQPALTCWNKSDLKTRVCVSVEQLANNTGINRNIEPGRDDKNLIPVRVITDDSNWTKLTPAGRNDDDEVVSLRLQFDEGGSDGNYSLNLKYGGAKAMDTNEESEVIVRLNMEYFPRNMKISTGSEELREDKMTRYRLPNNTVPRTYWIVISPNMEDEKFTWIGMVSVDIVVMDSTSVLTLHAYKNLEICETCTSLVDSNKTILTPVRHTRDDEVEFLRLQFDREIPVGEYTLNLGFRGAECTDANEEPKDPSDLSEEEFVGIQGEKIPGGFYKISRTIAGTHFEATKARRAFPCWDEPSFKARFFVVIEHLPNYTAISNMPEIVRAKSSNDTIMTVFYPTPNMPTYLLTFVISDYRATLNEHKNVSLYTSKQALKEAMHLLDLSPKVLKVMESYTGLPFGLPRVGSVLLPVYSTGATEHWGLVTYRESMIRFDSTVNTTQEQDSAGTLIAHELSHSWFGNRVTPLWWNDLWLNEAFATYFQYYIMDEIDESWRGVELFIVSVIQEGAFPYDDGTKGPVRWMPVTNAEIAQMFGPIVYAKGAAILHMFRNVLGDDAFRVGIRKYIAEHSFGTAVADDLITAFQEAYEEDSSQKKPLKLGEVMMPWLEQKGYPMVSVIRNYTTGATEVSQKNTIDGSYDRWWIPLTFATKSSPNFTSTFPARWISDKEDRVTLDGIDKDDWIILNIQANGYYRVNYDDENWKRLVDYLNTDDFRKIHVLNRAQLISDAFYLVQREPSRYFKIFYRLTDYLSREDEYLPWRSAYNAIIQIEGSLQNTEAHEMFMKRICELMDSYVEKVGFEVRETDDHFTKLSRTDVIRLVCRFGHTGCSEHAARKLVKLAENPVENRLHPDTVKFIYCAGLRGLNGTEARRFAKWAYEHTRDTFTENVACTENHEIHGDIFNAMLTENITNLDKPYRLFIFLLTSSEENFNYAVDFFLENHRAFNNSDYDLNYVPDMVANILEVVNTRAQLEKFEQVLQLNALIEDPKIPTTNVSALAKSKVIEAEAASDPFIELFNKQLSADNSISDEKITKQ